MALAWQPLKPEGLLRLVLPGCVELPQQEGGGPAPAEEDREVNQ